MIQLHNAIRYTVYCNKKDTESLHLTDLFFFHNMKECNVILMCHISITTYSVHCISSIIMATVFTVHLSNLSDKEMC